MRQSISVVRMKCVGYDHDFLQVLAAAHAIWIPPPKVRTGVRRRRGRKAEVSSAELELKSESDSEWKPIPRPRSTRKRQAVRPRVATKRVQRNDDDGLSDLTELESN
jgi:hypothetical protein